MSSLYYQGHLSGAYIEQILFGRLFTVLSTILFLLSIAIWSARASTSECYTFLFIAGMSTFIFLFFAYVQQFFFYLHIPFFVESRSDMHGVPQVLRSIIPNRITSIAREPNFYAPVLIESIIISRFIFSGFWKYVFIFSTLVILVLTFSGGAYAHLILLLLFFIVQRITFTSKGLMSLLKIITVCLVFGLVVSMLFENEIAILLDFIEAKTSTESSGASFRSQVMTVIFNEWSSSSLKSLIFGHGIGTLAFFNEISGGRIYLDFAITNNFYLDYLWDTGIIGLLLFVVFWGYGFSFFFNRRKKSIFFESGLLLFFSLLITGLYRSEYVTTHFSWVLALVIVIYRVCYLSTKDIVFDHAAKS
ncbi:hypothetical protein ACK37B_00050 [Aeromonas veronii]|uniref:hypothetical protein n=1 Tax=Aeromonas veronii TaxID=654 RepID=UPI0012F6CECE|nr:hypothetical protein [Aeromonas veronii]QGW96324.1 hypothetical protein FGM04_07020 [Aeromonas veronii]